MALNLPNNPTIGQTITEGSRAWTWNGRYWQATSLNVGYTGSQGDLGYTGSQGADGNFGGVTLDYTYSDNNDSTVYPGAGKLKFNTSDMTQAASLIIADSDDNAINLDNYFTTISASTSEIRGHFKVTKKSYPEFFVMFAITGDIDSFDDYYVVPCSFVSGNLTDSSTAFELDDDVLITFARTGDKGDIGYTGSQGAQGPIGYTGSAGAAAAGNGARYINLVMSGEITPPIQGQARFYPPESLTITRIYASISSQASGGDFTFRLNKNGVDLGLNLAILSGSFTMTPVTTDVDVNAGDYITLDITGVGSRDLHVKMEYELSV